MPAIEDTKIERKIMVLGKFQFSMSVLEKNKLHKPEYI